MNELTLITGATGCLGSNLTRELVHRGDRVAILRLPDDRATALHDVAGEVEHRIADVRDAAAVERALDDVGRVYHLAGFAIPTNIFTRRLHEVNVSGTLNVMRAALRAGVDRVVATSSVSAVGFPGDGVVADEDFPFNGLVFRHAYAVSKHLGELAVLRHVIRGLDAVILNPAAVMAPGGSIVHGWAGLVDRVRRRRLPGVPGGGISMATGADVVDAFLKAMEHGARGERYIVTTANLPYAELVRRIARVVGVAPPRLRLPAVAIAAGARIATVAGWAVRDPFRRPMLTPENVPLLTSAMYYDGSKARRELGVGTTPLEDAIAETAAWIDRARAAP